LSALEATAAKKKKKSPLPCLPALLQRNAGIETKKLRAQDSPPSPPKPA
jgi:hypothetical protein